jgi:hypothetical protein
VAADVLNAERRTTRSITNGGIVKELLRVTHVNVLWSFSRTWGQYPLAPPIFSSLENFLRGQIASTDELTVGSSCREWTPRIKVYQTTKAKNIMAKVMGFLKSLVPSFDLAFAPQAA